MGYIKVKDKEILRRIDEEFILPNGWDEFVKKQAKSHNLIIKSSKCRCFCTNCKREFVSNKRINEYEKCPQCHNKYLIKRSNLKYYKFKDYLSILDKVDNTLIVRYFELKTTIDSQHQAKSSVVEFGREIPDKTSKRAVYVNDRVSRCQGCIHICHSNYYDERKWREYTRNYSLIDYSIPFPNNIKNTLKDTPFKYSRIWDIVKHSPFYLDLAKLIQNTSEILKVEMLAKLKLYKLALNAYWCNPKGSFQSIFGVPKTFYSFMRRNNITYRATYVYDISQTTGKKLPFENEVMNTNTKKDLFYNLCAFSPFQIKENEGLGKVQGYWNPKEKCIVLNKMLSIDDKASTLLHELTHAFYDDFNYKSERNLSETFVESVAYIVADHFGLDTSSCSFKYILSWIDGDINILLELGEKIQKTANEFIKRLENYMEIENIKVAG